MDIRSKIMHRDMSVKELDAVIKQANAEIEFWEHQRNSAANWKASKAATWELSTDDEGEWLGVVTGGNYYFELPDYTEDESRELVDVLNAKDARITALEAENAKLHAAVDSAIRKLYAVVSRAEWVNAGYDPQEYDDMVKMFDDTPDAG